MSCPSYNCGCSTPCDPCSAVQGCPVQLDFACVFYHKDNTKATELDGLNFTNGATLEAIIEAIDEKVKQLGISGFLLPYLRASYVVNSLEQFTGAVDSELNDLRTAVDTQALVSQTPLSVSDSATVDLTSSGTLGHTLSASVKLSTGVAGNLVTAQSDGIHVAPQTLSIDYVNKTISVSSGNTVSIASLLSGPGGWLGNLASDPSANDGQYYWNTTGSALKIKVNGTWRTITTS